VLLQEAGKYPIMTKLIDILDDNLSEYQIVYRIHATRRMFERNINNEDIELILKNGQVIERYDDDFPLPSLLLNGKTKIARYLHVVLGINLFEKKLIIITAYEPNTMLWINDFSRRLKI